MQKEKLIQEEHDARQHSVGAPIGNQNAKKQSGEIHHFDSENPKANKIRKEIAKEHNITENAVRTAVEVGRGIDRAAEVDDRSDHIEKSTSVFFVFAEFFRECLLCTPSARLRNRDRKRLAVICPGMAFCPRRLCDSVTHELAESNKTPPVRSRRQHPPAPP